MAQNVFCLVTILLDMATLIPTRPRAARENGRRQSPASPIPSAT